MQPQNGYVPFGPNWRRELRTPWIALMWMGVAGTIVLGLTAVYFAFLPRSQSMQVPKTPVIAAPYVSIALPTLVDGPVVDPLLDSLIRQQLGGEGSRKLNKEDLRTISSLRAENQFVRSLKGLPVLTDLTDLQLINVTSFPNPADPPSIPLDTSSLRTMSQLQVLDLSYNWMPGIEPLGHLLNLRVLKLRGVKVPWTAQQPLHQLSQLTQLEELDLSEIKSEWPADAFEAFRNCQQLRRLTLQSVRFSEQEAYVLASLGKLHTLEELDLSGSTGYSLGGLQDCVSLRLLDIRHPAGRPQDSVRDLDPLIGNPTFRKLGTLRITKAQEELLAVDLAFLQETGMRVEVEK